VTKPLSRQGGAYTLFTQCDCEPTLDRRPKRFRPHWSTFSYAGFRRLAGADPISQPIVFRGDAARA